MRPRPEGRGEPLPWPANQPDRGRLQCGHGPKAVENADRQVHGTCSWRMLQCGHGPKAVENARIANYRRRTSGGASMRPRPEGRGEPRRRYQQWFLSMPASMRPRPEGRGEPPFARTAYAYRASFNAATARRPWRTAPRRRADSGPMRSFNAATARRPWRTGNRHLILDHYRRPNLDHRQEEESLGLLGVFIFLRLHRLAEAKTFAVHLEDVATVRQAVQQGRGHPLALEHLAPFAERPGCS